MALFLRNHDELTLEMVTDEDRDYMYYEYAADPMARLNVGIKRRLAPLLDGSRHRIELLNSFLFSFPGTPIIYYGDEIGMGDNIFLGDRNGVRTPMQWTGDRNAGFSRADPARLYSPPVMDPVYGYQAINIEAQERDPSSFLNWMKRMISLRRRLKVFSRGSMELLFPQNRKVLAYIRRFEDETVLAVANLSRFIQPAELDLSAFKGLTPVELMGKAEFPVIGERPYFVTLSPHSFMWFYLQKQTVSTSSPGEVPFADLPVLTIDNADGWPGIFKGNAKRRLETDILPRYIQRQRWFGSKARKMVAVRISDWGEIARKEAHGYMVIADAEFVSGLPETYLVPIAIAIGSDAEAISNNYPSSSIARITGFEEPSLLYDGYRSDAIATAIFDTIGRGMEITMQKGSIKAEASSAYEAIFRPIDALPFRPSVLAADQSNTSILYGERFILKMLRHIQNGVNPDYEIGLYLTEKAGFKNVPRTAGGVWYARPGEKDTTVGVLVEQMENQGSGWAYAMSTLSRYFEFIHTLPADSIPQDIPLATSLSLSATDDSPQAKEVVGPYLNAAATLGQRTAEMHLALARNTEYPAFSPEPLTSSDLTSLSNAMKDFTQRSLRALENNLANLPESLHEQAYAILGSGKKFLDRLKPPKMADIPGGKIRCHGDYHLGQVLWVENDFIIIDFEGEPSRPLAERRAKQCPLKDVAGMLGSYEYVAQSALAQFTQDRPEQFSRLLPWTVFWQKRVSASFLRSYLATAKGAQFLGIEPLQFETLLDMFYLDKTFYELFYELNNRPDWVRIPLEKLTAL